MKKMTNTLLTVSLLTLVLAPQGLFAQNIDKAVQAYKSGNYVDSAIRFYEVLNYEEDPSLVAEAEYGVASSLEKTKLYLSAFKYYAIIVQEGSDHPFFAKAVEGLLDVGDALKDDVYVPQILDSIYDSNHNALKRLTGDVLPRIHYAVGERLFRVGDFNVSRDFLSTVREGSSVYPASQYLIGLQYARIGQSASARRNYKKANVAFENVRRTVPFKVEDKDLQNLRDMASLGIARLNYERAYLKDDGDPERDRLINLAISEYRDIPRFSQGWADAIFERGWAHAVKGEYGKTLGAVRDLLSPYFYDNFYPEAYILRAIAYYYNCQWDRVAGTLKEANERIEPMVGALDEVLEQDYDAEEWFTLFQKSMKAGTEGGEGLIPWPVVAQIPSSHKYIKLMHFLKEVEREQLFFTKDPNIARGHLGRDMSDYVDETRSSFVRGIGSWIRSELKRSKNDLEGVLTRITIVDLETSTAETEWLSIGREIGGKVRTRLPRPFVPNDTFQFWWHRGEYWLDELGFHEYTIKTECYE